ncbi:MAG: T9SS type A sorting domain-containing protein [Saprospiraceae bacterium]|nr:T9SS type A sorting domain-containing protein [Saprospiraceae bacterium]
MIRALLMILLMVGLTIDGSSQSRIARVDSSGIVSVLDFGGNETPFPNRKVHGGERKRRPLQIDGFPLQFKADRVYKNFRNITLHDLDGDGADELIFGIANRMYRYDGAIETWSRPLSGLARYPVAIGDLEGDGVDELVMLTGFSDQESEVYVLNGDGTTVDNWPRSYGGFWKLSSPALADLDGDSDLEIVFGDFVNGAGALHAVHHDGSLLSPEWPLDLPNVPAATPSIGDLDRDGRPEIVIPTTREIYVVRTDASISEGWPIDFPGTKFSYQSPVLVDLLGDEVLEILGTGHGDLPLYFALDRTGQPLPGWPIDIVNSWSFHPPTWTEFDGRQYIINAKPGSQEIEDAIYVRDETGKLYDGYPIRQKGGHEGVTTIADVDGDEDPDLVFSSNVITPEGEGQIFAYDLLSGELLDGYPVLPRGFTFMNGATFGDIDGDQLMDMVVLSYTEHENSREDTTWINAYALNVPVRTWWSTYKGDNHRTGLVNRASSTAVGGHARSRIRLAPNPSKDHVFFLSSLSSFSSWPYTLYSASGQVIFSSRTDRGLDLSDVSPGVYFVVISHADGHEVHKILRIP